MFRTSGKNVGCFVLVLLAFSLFGMNFDMDMWLMLVSGNLTTLLTCFGFMFLPTRRLIIMNMYNLHSYIPPNLNWVLPCRHICFVSYPNPVPYPCFIVSTRCMPQQKASPIEKRGRKQMLSPNPHENFYQASYDRKYSGQKNSQNEI